MAAPPSGWLAGAGRGAAEGALVSVVAGVKVGAVALGPCAGDLCGAQVAWFLGWTAAGLALAPVIALAGAVVGAVAAPPPEQVRRAQGALIDAVTAVNPPRTIRDETIRLGSERSWHTLVPMSGQGLEAADHEVGTVLEISIRRIGLEAGAASRKPRSSVWFSTDPELELRLDVDARLLKASDGAVVYSGSFREFGALRKFSDWVADDGRAFRDDLAWAAGRVADRIAATLFPGPEPWAETSGQEPAPKPSAEPEARGPEKED